MPSLGFGTYFFILFYVENTNCWSQRSCSFSLYLQCLTCWIMPSTTTWWLNDNETTIIISVIQMRKLKFKASRISVQGYVACGWQGQDSNLVFLALDITLGCWQENLYRHQPHNNLKKRHSILSQTGALTGFLLVLEGALEVGVLQEDRVCGLSWKPWQVCRV